MCSFDEFCMYICVNIGCCYFCSGFYCCIVWGFGLLNCLIEVCWKDVRWYGFYGCFWSWSRILIVSKCFCICGCKWWFYLVDYGGNCLLLCVWKGLLIMRDWEWKFFVIWFIVLKNMVIRIFEVRNYFVGCIRNRCGGFLVIVCSIGNGGVNFVFCNGND